jgi:hypothetical protein
MMNLLHKILLISGILWIGKEDLFAQFAYKFVKEIDKNFYSVTVDELGYIHACDATVLHKYDKYGEFLFSYSDLAVGQISSFDVSNPMKILVFFKDFLTLTFLDNKLAVQQKIRLDADLNLHAPLCACVSYDNGFWIYDQNSDQLFRYNAEGKLKSNSQMISNLFNFEILPVGMCELPSGYLLLHDTVHGMFIFDHFGAYIKHIPVQTAAFQAYGKNIYYLFNGFYHSINIETSEHKQIALPRPDIDFLVHKNKTVAALIANKKLLIYSID